MFVAVVVVLQFDLIFPASKMIDLRSFGHKDEKICTPEPLAIPIFTFLQVSNLLASQRCFQVKSGEGIIRNFPYHALVKRFRK